MSLLPASQASKKWCVYLVLVGPRPRLGLMNPCPRPLPTTAAPVHADLFTSLLLHASVVSHSVSLILSPFLPACPPLSSQLHPLESRIPWLLSVPALARGSASLRDD